VKRRGPISIGSASVNRRQFVQLIGTATLAWPFAARGQKAMPVIGWLSNLSVDSPILAQGGIAAFREGLSKAGYVEGQNVAIEYRWAEGSYDRLPALAADLVSRKVDVIAASGGGDVASRAAKAATSTIPIVFIGGGDPVEAGLVASLGRPGGNITGISSIAVELTPKRLELLSELVPQARAIAFLVNPNSPTAERTIRDMQEAARAKGVQLPILKAAGESEFVTAFASLGQQHAGGIVVAADPFFGQRREELATLAARHRIPAIYAFREYVDSGGLISYGPSLTATYRQAGTYVGRILAGAKPADLPMQQPTIFELVVNMNTARALGLNVPRSLLARADEVIE
jgi:putative tryptophan/tyrosine transport system substrate-binding protein